MKSDFLLGVLGGLGPMSTFYFCELVTSHTFAGCDADHIDMLISSRASTPDRTAYILGKSTESPLPIMQKEARRLIDAGADLLVIPCNTAHYFYDGLTDVSSVPILNIIEETVKYLQKKGITTFGLLATEGTVKSESYHRLCKKHGITCITPSQEGQEKISEIIYNAIKQNKPVDMDAFSQISKDLLKQGCECLVLGCTELSLLRQTGLDHEIYVDSLEVLAYRTIVACNKKPIGFPKEFECMQEDEI